MNQELIDLSYSELDAILFNVMTKVSALRGRGIEIYPPEGQELSFLNPFKNLSEVKVIIVGQDPYINPGQAHGMAFSVNQGVKIPPSLQNIYKELESDLGIPVSTSGYLWSWASQGVLLMNRLLTVTKGQSGSHAGFGWEEFTNKLISLVDSEASPCVFLLWGKKAQQLKELIQNPNNLVLEAAHPSPFSAHRGFLGCKHFSKANSFLIENGRKPIDWRVEDAAI